MFDTNDAQTIRGNVQNSIRRVKVIFLFRGLVGGDINLQWKMNVDTIFLGGSKSNLGVAYCTTARGIHQV